MSQNLNNHMAQHRDYGAISSTSSSSNMANSTGASTSSVPDVDFSGFSPTEFMSLSENIAHNINTVNSSWKQLEKILKIIGTSKDQASTRDKVHNIHAKTNARIEATSKDLQRLTAVVRRGDKQQKLQLVKLTNDFRTVVELYSSVQQRIVNAMRRTYTQVQNAQMQDDQQETDRAELLQRQREIQANLQFEQEMLIDRERQIRQIEANILDVNSIMLKISTIVQAQSEQVDRIETTIENSAANVESGRDELEKASQMRRSYRRKMMILLAIAVIVGLIVTGIIVGKLKS